MGEQEGAAAFLCRMRSERWESERDVAGRLIEPCLAILGWDDRSIRREVAIALTTAMAKLWKYRSGKMWRDYVLSWKGRQVVHIEAKHDWPRHRLDLDAFLQAINRGDWSGTYTDGEKKDLALLLWGAKRQGVRRAVLLDEHRLMVFDWESGWALRSEVKPFEDSAHDVDAAFGLLAPKAFGWGA